MKIVISLIYVIILSMNPVNAMTLKNDVSQQSQFDIDKETEVYLNTLTDEEKERSDAYFEGGYWLLLWGVVIDILVAWLLLAKGFSLKLKNAIEGKIRNVNIKNFLYIAAYSLITYVMVYPWTLYTDFFREHQYDLANQEFGGWMGDQLTAIIVSIIFGGLLFTVLYVAIRKLGQTWWLWGSLITFVFLILLIFISPVFISPLFNQYTPLEDGPIKESVLSMARANGIPVDNVYMFDASKQSDRISANVSGIGSTIRISLNDNLLNQCNEAEIESVMGHEMGHYILNHSYELLLVFGLVFLVGFAFINWAYYAVLRKWGSGWGISQLSDVAGFPLIMALLSVYFFLATPVTNSIIRTNEEEADAFGLNVAREPDGFASVAMKLSTYRKISPGYWERLIFFDHPSGYDRVRMAMTWKSEYMSKE